MKKYINLYLFLLLCLCACSDEKENLAEPYLKIELESDVVNVPIKGKTEIIKIHTNISNWELLPQTSGGYDWCETSIALSKTEVYLLTVTVTPNEGVEKREAEFVIRGSGTKDLIIRVVQLGSEPEILANVASKILPKEIQSFTIKVTGNVEYVLRNNAAWLLLKENPSARGMVETEHQYSVTANTELSVRRDTIYVESLNQTANPIILKIPVEQESADMDDVISEDTKIQIETVEMIQGTVYGAQKPNLTIDGSISTYYGSGKQAERKPIIFDYKLKEGVAQVDYIVLHQRTTATTHNQLTKGQIEYKTSTDSDWLKCGTFEELEIVPSIRIDVNLVRPTHIRLTFERTPEPYEGSVSLAEFECYQKAEGSDFDLVADATYFGDDVFSQLKPTTTQEDVSKITHPMVRAVAQELLDGTYTHEFRARTYHSCKNPATVGKELTIGKRSICDNPTGLYFEKEKKYIVFVGNEMGEQSLNLYIRDWRENGGSQTIKLKRGLNKVETTVDGTGYIQYWTETEDAKPAIRVHVCYGNEIGFWDVRAEHTNGDWKRVLNVANSCAQRLNLTNGMLDVLGERVQLINTIQAFNLYCPNDIEGVMAMHDELMQIEYTTMGLVKNNAVPRNRMLGVRSWGGSPNWNGTCANYPNTEKPMLNRQAFLENIWVFGHEFGHGNQLNQMKGAGWAEVTNNVYAQQAMYLMNDGFCRLEHTEFRRQGYNDKVIADRFNAYLNDAIVKGKPYLTHEGELVHDPDKGVFYQSDPFVSLAPLWQLSLFFMFAENTSWCKPDFWADIHWAAIHDNRESYTYGERYVNFMKRCMDASGVDLTDFFKQMGLLREMDMKVGDYGSPKQITITAAMVHAVEVYGRNRQRAPTPAMHYISGNSIEAYKKQLPVQGSFNQGITDGNLHKTISHSVWKNMAVFETYAGSQLIEIAITGTGSATNLNTFVRYPNSSTRIEAVAWDGQRTLVYGKR